MIRRLIILLLIVGCVFGDTIQWQDAKGKTHTVRDVDFQKCKFQRAYYIDVRGKKDSINCASIIFITGRSGKKIECDCDFDIGGAKDFNIESNSKSKLKQAGNHLVRFRDEYYTGFLVSMLRNVATLYGASENKSDIILFGGVASLLGGIMMLISFDSIGEAGKDLIDAGEKLEAEQPKEDE